MKLYLAYGANTNFRSMKERCPAARYVATIPLHHHRLVFRGVADVVPARGARAMCGLWLITPECEESLDRFEGFPRLYVKKYVTTRIEGRRHRVMLYVMRNPGARGQALPSAAYEATLRKGYVDCGIGALQLDNAIERARKWARENRPAQLYTGSWRTEQVEPGDGVALTVSVNDDDALNRALNDERFDVNPYY